MDLYQNVLHCTVFFPPFFIEIGGIKGENLNETRWGFYFCPHWSVAVEAHDNFTTPDVKA